MMQNLWSDERNWLRYDFVKAELLVKSTRDFLCFQFLTVYYPGKKSPSKAVKNWQKFREFTEHEQ